MTATPKPHVMNCNLDWTRLLGFDQTPTCGDEAARKGLSNNDAAKLGVKLGGKVGNGKG